LRSKYPSNPPNTSAVNGNTFAPASLDAARAEIQLSFNLYPMLNYCFGQYDCNGFYGRGSLARIRLVYFISYGFGFFLHFIKQFPPIHIMSTGEELRAIPAG